MIDWTEVDDMDLLTLSFALTFARPDAINDEMRERKTVLQSAIAREIHRRGVALMARDAALARDP